MGPLLPLAARWPRRCWRGPARRRVGRNGDGGIGTEFVDRAHGGGLQHPRVRVAKRMSLIVENFASIVLQRLNDVLSKWGLGRDEERHRSGRLNGL